MCTERGWYSRQYCCRAASTTAGDWSSGEREGEGLMWRKVDKQGLAFFDIQTEFPTSLYIGCKYYKVKLRRTIIIRSLQMRR